MSRTIVFLGLVLVACGDSNSARKANSNDTEADGGEVGVVQATQCEPGETRTCVGVGACEGGQTCEDDGRWEECQCGDNSGLAGSDGGAGKSNMPPAVPAPPACGDGLRDCDGVCKAVMLDPDNCGSCYHVCPDRYICESGNCVCGPGFDLCNGDCIDLLSDPDHCGWCETVCELPQRCIRGTCG